MYNCTLLDKKILGRGVSDSLSVAFSTDFKKIIVHGCTIRWQHYVLSNNFNTSNIWHWYCRRKHADFYVGVWTITPLFAPNGSVIAAVFTPTWGPVELDLSPWDSPKGFCNLGCVSGGVNIAVTPVAKDIWQILVQTQFWLVMIMIMNFFGHDHDHYDKNQCDKKT